MITAINLKKMFVSILIVALIGAISIIIASTAFGMWGEITTPDSAAPLGFLIGMWFGLFALLGVALYFVKSSSDKNKSGALKRFWLQLLFMCVWPILFFNLRLFGFAAIWMLLSIALKFIAIRGVKKVSKGSAYLMIPYFLFGLYLLYINYGVFMLN